MKWLKRFLGRCAAMPCPKAYDQGYQDGYQEGYKEGQDWGHEHGACEHTHPFEEALSAMGEGDKTKDRLRAPGWGTHKPQTSTKGR